MDRRFTFVVLLLLCLPTGMSWVFGCNKPGPEDCDFDYYDRRERQYQHTFCSWESDGAFKGYFFPSEPNNFFVGLDKTKHFAQLTSREACSTEGETYCLKFRYLIREDNTDLSVSIKYEGSEEAEPPIWIMSSSSDWDRARVPITTQNEFSVVFKARRRSTEPTNLEPVFIDDVEYEKRTRCTLLPRNATPPPVSTTPTTLPTTTTTSTTAPTTTTTTTTRTYSTRRTRVAETATSEVSSSITTVNTTNVSNNLTETESQGMHSAGQSKKIGLIVGVVVAVVIVSILLLLLVLFRRRLLEACKRRFKNEQQKHGEDSHSPEDSHYANAAGFKHVDSAPKHHIETRTSAETSDYYSFVSSQDDMQLPSESEAAQYAVVNKPGKGTQPGSSKSRGKPSTTTDATTNESHYYSSATEAEYNNIPFQAGRQNGDVSLSASTKTSTNDSKTAAYYVLEEQRADTDSSAYQGQKDHATASKPQPDVYNSLDFDGKGFKAGKTGNDLGTVYSHLNEGLEGTYNEVDRQKRAEVIDSEYSHIS